MFIFRFFAALILVGLLAVVGVSLYNAGVSAGIASDVGNAIASGAPLPAGYYYPGPYVGHPWGYGFGGFGFFGLIFGIFFLFLIFGLIRAAFGWGRWGGRHDGYSKWGGHHGGPREYLDEWHRERHAESSGGVTPDKA